MKSFFNKFFSNANKLINITCAVLSVIVFVLCIFNILAKAFGSTYEGSTTQITVEDRYITNDIYSIEGSTTKREKVTFTKESDGTYGQTAILEVLEYLENERNRAFSEGGVISQSSGVTTAIATVAGISVTVVQGNSMYCEQDVNGKVYYEEATKELSDTNYGPASCMNLYTDGDKCRYEHHKDSPAYVSLKNNVPVGKFNGSNIKEDSYANVLDKVGAFSDTLPLGFTTDVSQIDLTSCELVESMVGYKLTYNVKIDGNEFVKIYEKKFGDAAGAIKNTTRISRFQIIISLSKYGQITGYDANYAFRLTMNMFGGVDTSTSGGLKTNVTYKSADFRAKEF